MILEAGPLSAKRLAELLEQSPPKVLRHLSDMRRMGWVEVARGDDGTPGWSIAKEPEDGSRETEEPFALSANLLSIGVKF